MNILWIFVVNKITNISMQIQNQFVAKMEYYVIYHIKKLKIHIYHKKIELNMINF